MWTIAWAELAVCWCAWLYPLLGRAPHRQKRESITVPGPTRIGLLLESIAIWLAFIFRVPVDSAPGLVQLGVAMVLGVVSAILSWTSVTHLGKQFRVHAGLYADHELVRTGPYAVVRHPIYSSLLAMLLCTIVLVTEWRWALVSVALFVVGTEIRVRSEERLLASRFGEEFEEYRRKTPAYVPLVR